MGALQMTALLDQTRTPAEDARDYAQSRTAVPTGVEQIAAGQEFLAEQFAHLGALIPDWDGYGARAIDAATLKRARTIAEGELEPR